MFINDTTTVKLVKNQQESQFHVVTQLPRSEHKRIDFVAVLKRI